MILSSQTAFVLGHNTILSSESLCENGEKHNLRGAGSSLTFIGYPEAQGAAGVIRFEIEPHLVTRAHHKIWCGRTRQAAERRSMGRASYQTMESSSPHIFATATEDGILHLRLHLSPRCC